MPVNFVANYLNNFPGTAQAAVARAFATWSAALDSTVPVAVTAVWGVVMPQNLTAMCIPNANENFAGAPIQNVWYPSALADKLANQNLHVNEPDMTVFFSGANWNHGPGNPQQNELDLESVALHELCHGLGFVSAFWVDPAWPFVGSYGNDALIALVNHVVQGTGQQLGFALPQLNWHPSVYGVHIQKQDGAHLTSPGQFNNLSVELGDAMAGNNIYFDVGHHSLYAPNPFVPFTSVDHLDSGNSLMRPSIAPGQVVRNIDAPVQNILHSLGW